MEHEPQQAAFWGDPPAASAQVDAVDRRELAIVAVERTRMPMVVTDPRRLDNPIVLANQAFLDLTGYSADEVLGRNSRFMQGPETDPAAVKTIRDGLASNADVISTEFLNYRKDGSTFWNELSISPVRDDKGRSSTTSAPRRTCPRSAGRNSWSGPSIFFSARSIIAP